MHLPRIVKDYLTVSSGVALGHVLTLITMPVISRLYSAESFGVFGTFMSMVAIIGTISTFQYSSALIIPKSDSESANVFMVGCLSVVSITVIISILSGFLPQIILSWIKAPGNYILLLLLPLYVLFNGANQMLLGWSIRRKQFIQNTISQIARSATVNGFQIIFAPISATGGILSTGAVIGEISSCLNLGYIFWKKEKKFFSKCLSISMMKKVAKSYYDFPVFSSPQVFINAFSQSLPILLLGYYYGIAVAGFYAFGIRLVQAPINLMLNPLRQVLFQKFCELQSEGKSIFPAYCKSTLLLAAVIVVPISIGMVISPLLFSIIFGDKWRLAGVFARWLFLWQAFLFCNLPSILIVKILRMQFFMLIFSIFTLCFRTIVLIIGGIYWRETFTIAVFAGTGAFLNLFLIVLIWLRVEKEETAGKSVCLNEGPS